MLEYRPNVKVRRLIASVLIVLGVVILFAAPETPGGLFAIAAGVVIELAGIAMEKRR
jgi:drug/metabolite transporter (DMT)-like permease